MRLIVVQSRQVDRQVVQGHGAKQAGWFAVLVEFILRPTAERAPGNVVLAGLLPGLVYLAGAAGWLVHVGWW